MIVNNVFLEAVAVKPEQYPEPSIPEIAFAGRSNVGKSTLLNAMINRKSLARTSQTPGKTRTINFYNVENILRFVDLPGYGYAKISREESAKWGKMIESYLLKRPVLKAIVMLIDIRHDVTENDKLMYDFLTYYNYQIIITATKADKVSKNEMSKNKNNISKQLKYTGEVIPFSGVSKIGREELWEKLLPLYSDITEDTEYMELGNEKPVQ
ncbi:MAG: ribosome biogenesis GTP-binding protein YihA/YsxC [Clostridiales bacterium]|jgi:GTP-binding protein|nr:ribosome biogenesis GTP-binding protein YihA/YsxC [Clostridiales bacterium]